MALLDEAAIIALFALEFAYPERTPKRFGPSQVIDQQDKVRKRPIILFDGRYLSAADKVAVAIIRSF